MRALDVSEDPLKAVLGQAGELVARLKSNGMLTHYSPSSRVLELEGLLAGIDAKRSLWRSLRAAGVAHSAPNGPDLEELIARATSQRERLQAEHERRRSSPSLPTDSRPGASASRPTHRARGGRD